MSSRPPAPPSARAVLAIVREWSSPVATALLLFGWRVSSPDSRLELLEQRERAGLARDSVSILDREALRGAVSLLGRGDCRDHLDRALERGIPCGQLLQGMPWPLLHSLPPRAGTATASPAVVLRAASRDGVPAPLPRPLAAGVLLPAALPTGLTRQLR